MKRFLAMLLVAICPALHGAVMNNTYVTNNPGQFPLLLAAPAATSNWFVVIHSDGLGTVLESPKFTGINTNLNWNGQFGADTGKFTNGLTLNGSPVLTNAASAETTATNIVTLTQTTTNVSAMDYSLVQRGGTFKLVLTGNAYIGAPSGVANTSFTKATLMVQQPSTGTCLLTFTNGFYAFPEGIAPVIDTNNGAVTVFEFKSDVFTNGLLHGWMSLKSKLIP